MHPAVKEYIESLRLQPRTIETYLKLLNRFFAHVGPDRPLKDISLTTFNTFIKKLESEGCSSQTIASYSICLRLFFRFHNLDALADRITIPSVKHQKRNHISHLYWVDLFAAAGKDKSGGLRAQAICAVLLGTSMRLSEAINMKVGDVDWAKKHIRVIIKGGEEAYYNMVLLDDLENYLKPYIGTRKSGYVFQGANGKHLSGRTVEYIVKRAAILAKVPFAKQISPHALRHSLANWMLWEQKWPSLVVQKILHHRRIQTTQLYTDGQQDEIDNFVEKNRPF